MFDFLFGKKVDSQKKESLNNKRELDSLYPYEIVGEKSYQSNIKKIAGVKTKYAKEFETVAVVISEPTNKFDENAIKVEINGSTVGYLPKSDAQKLSKNGLIHKNVKAVVVGGWKDAESEGDYGVRLAISSINELK